MRGPVAQVTMANLAQDKIPKHNLGRSCSHRITSISCFTSHICRVMVPSTFARRTVLFARWIVLLVDFLLLM